MLGRLRIVVACVVAVGGVLVGPTPPATALAACTANITFTYAPGITVLPTPQAVTGTLVLNCPVLSPDAGMWTLPFAGAGAPESCEVGIDALAFVAGAVGPPGAVAGGFNFVHAYAGLSELRGTITWPGNVKTLEGVGEWLPVLVPGNCVAPVTGGTFIGAAAVVP